MKIVFLDASTLGEEADLSPVAALGSLECHSVTSPHEVVARLVGARVAITNKVVLPGEMLDVLPELRLICVAATGMNNIDLSAASKHGIVVRNVLGYSTPSVTQHTFAMLFHLWERMGYYDAYTREGSWCDSPIFTHLGRPYHDLEGKIWGIIGMGAIGREVASCARAFGCEVHYHSTSGANLDAGYSHRSLESLLSESDIVSIHAPLNDSTRGLIHAANLPLLKPGCVLLNLGRGGIIDETALAHALVNQDLYAGLDVLEHEPMRPDHPLRALSHSPRLLLTPHIAWASVQSRQRLIAGIARNIREFMQSFS